MSSENDKYIVLKLALLGDAAVEKTSLVDMCTQNRYKEDYKPTLGVNIVLKELEYENIKVQIRLLIWDIVGQEKYDLSRKVFFQGVLGTLFIFDTTRQPTFKNIESKWLKYLEEYGEQELAYILLRNKVDLHDSRVIITEEGKELADKINAFDFVEASAKYGDNVEAAFKKLVNKVLTNLEIGV